MVIAPHSKTTPLVSICLTTSAWKNKIDQAIESVLLQTYWNWELVIVRDYHNEDIDKTLSYYLARYSDRLRVKELEPTLPFEQAITCLSLAQGSYIATLQCGHTMQPNQLSYSVAFLKCYPVNEGVQIPNETLTMTGDTHQEQITPTLIGIQNLSAVFRDGEVLHGPSILARTKSVADHLPQLVSEAYTNNRDPIQTAVAAFA